MIFCGRKLSRVPGRFGSAFPRFRARAFEGFLWLWVAGILLVPGLSFANNAGGFTMAVTTAVTTGTETFGSHTDHYLDNGILHVAISPSGSVDSIKYLKPGLSGTPKANGTETVSQSGVNFGNHTAIYYYWYPDGNGGCVYSSTTTSSTNIDIAYLRTYNPAVDSVAANVELYYSLGKGNTGMYGYLIVRHPTNSTTFTTNDLNIASSRFSGRPRMTILISSAKIPMWTMA